MIKQEIREKIITMRKNDSSIKDIVSKTKVSERSVKNILKNAGLTKQSGKTNQMTVSNTPILNSDEFADKAKNLADLFFERAKIKPFDSEKEEAISHFYQLLSEGCRFNQLKAAVFQFVFTGYMKIKYLNSQFISKYEADIDEWEKFVSESHINNTVPNLIKNYLNDKFEDKLFKVPIYMREIRTASRIYKNLTIEKLKNIVTLLAELEIDLIYIKDRIGEFINSSVFDIDEQDKQFISELLDDYYDINNIKITPKRKKADLIRAIEIFMNKNYNHKQMKILIDQMTKEDISLNLIANKSDEYEKEFIINKYERKPHLRLEKLKSLLPRDELNNKYFMRFNNWNNRKKILYAAWVLFAEGDMTIQEMRKLYPKNLTEENKRDFEYYINYYCKALLDDRTIFAYSYSLNINNLFFNSRLKDNEYEYYGTKLQRHPANLYNPSRDREEWLNCSDLIGLIYTLPEFYFKVGLNRFEGFEWITDSYTWFKISNRTRIKLDGINLKDHARALLDNGQRVFTDEQVDELAEWVKLCDQKAQLGLAEERENNPQRWINVDKAFKFNTFEPFIGRAYTNCSYLDYIIMEEKERLKLTKQALDELLQSHKV